MNKKNLCFSDYDSMMSIIDEIFEKYVDSLTDKQDIYSKIVEELGIPRPTVQRVARDLRNELLAKIKILQEEEKSSKSKQSHIIKQNETNTSTIVNTNSKKETMTQPDVETTILTEFEKCRAKFEQIKPSLVKNPGFIGKYVAIVNNEIVDSDSNEETLVKRVYQKFGYIYTYIGFISEKAKPVRIPSVFGARR